MRLKIGDKVMWMSDWTPDAAPVEATVLGLTQTRLPASKRGKQCKSVAWASVQNDCVIVTMTNGRWAWGRNITPA